MTEEQKEIRRKRALEWNRNNRERMRLNQRLYQSRHREENNKRSAEYQKHNPDQNRERLRQWRIKYPWYDSWQCARQRCVNPKNPRYKYYGNRGISFSLSKADVSFMWIRDKAAEMKQPSIDRRNNDDNYTLDNCCFIEKSVNSKKARADYLNKMDLALNKNTN